MDIKAYSHVKTDIEEVRKLFQKKTGKKYDADHIRNMFTRLKSRLYYDNGKLIGLCLYNIVYDHRANQDILYIKEIFLDYWINLYAALQPICKEENLAFIGIMAMDKDLSSLLTQDNFRKTAEVVVHPNWIQDSKFPSIKGQRVCEQ